MPQEKLQSLNCGLSALSKLGSLKNVSAFTLVHLARDNGMSLQVFKVANKEDLVKVVRPAIFHQKDHFILINPDEAMPDGDYTCFVLGPTIHGRVVSLAEAKFVTGAKNFLTGENKDGVKEGGGALGGILGVVGAIVGTLILPGIGSALGFTTAAGAPALSGAAAGAIGGALGGGVGSGVTGDNAFIGAGLGALGGIGIGGGIAAASQGAAAGATSIGARIANFSQGAFNSLAHPIAALGSGGNLVAGAGIPSLAGQTAAFNAAAGGAANAAGASSAGIGAGATAANAFGASAPAMSLIGGGVGTAAGAALPNVGGFTANNFVNNPTFSYASIPGTSNVGGIGTAGAAKAATGGGLLNSATNAIGNAYSSNPIGTIATGIGALGTFGSQPPAYNGASPTDNYSAVSQFLGPNALTAPTTDQLNSYITTPIDDLAKTFTNNSTRVSDAINQSYDNQKQSLVHQFAQSGQNMSNSSELQDRVSQLEQKRSTDLSNAALEVQNAGIGQAIQIKQQALTQGMQAGQFNQTIAMQLAALTGDQQNLQYAIANNDYQSFQQIMGKLLTMGIPQSTTLNSNGKISTMTQTGGM